MLFHMFIFVLAAVLVFQGVNLLVERSAPSNVVPAEVRPTAPASKGWGSLLVAYGVLLALAALLSLSYPGLAGVLAPMRNLGFGILAGYGLWLVFGRKVNYTPARPAAGEAHGHGH
jgi:hypothetical protein